MAPQTRNMRKKQVRWNTTLPSETCSIILSKTSCYHAKMCAVSSQLLRSVVQQAKPIKFDAELWARQRLAADAKHSMAVTADGSLFSWGSGLYGKLGLDDEDTRMVPSLVQGVLRGKVVAQVAAAERHSVCVTADGEVYFWGRTVGEDNHNVVLLPVLVGGPLKGEVVAQVSAGYSFVVCVTVRGAVFSWGYGQFGKLGLGDEESKQLPTLVQGQLQGKTVAQVSAGANFTVAVTDEGEVFSWGNGRRAQLGVGDTDNRLVPTLIQTLQGKSVAHVSTGSYHAFAVTTNGALFSWGSNTCSQLGHGDTKIRIVPTLVQGELQGEAVAQVSAAHEVAVCVTVVGGVYAWGATGFEEGQPVGRVPRPTRVAGELQGREVAQAAAGDTHILCVTVDGAMYSWGIDSEALDTAPQTAVGRGALGLGDKGAGEIVTSPELIAELLGA